MMNSSDHEEHHITLSQTSSSSSPPWLSPFKYTPLTSPTHLPIDPHTFFYSQVITHSPPNFDSQQDHTEGLHQDCHPEKQEQQKDNVYRSLSPNYLYLDSEFYADKPELLHKDYRQQEQDRVSYLCPYPGYSITERCQFIDPLCLPLKKRRINIPEKSSLITLQAFPWATAIGTKLHTLEYMLSVLKLRYICGTLFCKFCKFQRNDVQFDLVEKFKKVKKYIMENRKKYMYDRRASNAWMHPMLPKCESCGKGNAMQPWITKKRNIN